MSRQQLQLELPARLGSWTLPSRLSPPTPFFPPQSSSFGSTDGIRTRVSVGPEREGWRPRCPGVAGVQLPGSLLVSEPQSLRPRSHCKSPHPVLSGGPRNSGPLPPHPWALFLTAPCSVFFITMYHCLGHHIYSLRIFYVSCTRAKFWESRNLVVLD